MTVAQAFVEEMNTQLGLARDELVAATADDDAEAADVAFGRLLDLTELLHRTGVDVTFVDEPSSAAMEGSGGGMPRGGPGDR